MKIDKRESVSSTKGIQLRFPRSRKSCAELQFTSIVMCVQDTKQRFTFRFTANSPHRKYSLIVYLDLHLRASSMKCYQFPSTIRSVPHDSHLTIAGMVFKSLKSRGHLKERETRNAHVRSPEIVNGNNYSVIMTLSLFRHLFFIFFLPTQKLGRICIFLFILMRINIYIFWGKYFHLLKFLFTIFHFSELIFRVKILIFQFFKKFVFKIK